VKKREIICGRGKSGATVGGKKLQSNPQQFRRQRFPVNKGSGLLAKIREKKR